MIAKFLAKILGTANERELKRMRTIVDKINSFEPKIKSLSDAELAAKTNEFRERLSKGETLMIFYQKHLLLCEKQVSGNLDSVILMCS